VFYKLLSYSFNDRRAPDRLLTFGHRAECRWSSGALGHPTVQLSSYPAIQLFWPRLNALGLKWVEWAGRGQRNIITNNIETDKLFVSLGRSGKAGLLEGNFL